METENTEDGQHEYFYLHIAELTFDDDDDDDLVKLWSVRYGHIIVLLRQILNLQNLKS